MDYPPRIGHWLSRIRRTVFTVVLPLVTGLVSAIVTPNVVQAQSVTTLLNFCGITSCLPGNEPYGLLQAIDGDFYGVTQGGGPNTNATLCPAGCGTAFKITVSGKLTTLYSFCAHAGCTDGESPSGNLVQAIDGDFYGTTMGGGANAAGSVFKMTADGSVSTLYSFCSQPNCTDGTGPSGIIQVANGDFYGTTSVGGANVSESCPQDGCGTVFKISPSGTLTTLYNFCSQPGCTDGDDPHLGLIQAANGDLYGTTFYGGNNGAGTVFKITLGGALTTLHIFDAADGVHPMGLIQAINGDIYGTTYQGGGNSHVDICPIGCGTLFDIAPDGTLTTLYNFCRQTNCADGSGPNGVVQASNGNVYGSTDLGGTDSYTGTLFEMTTKGALTTLYSFDGADGFYPGWLTQATNGNIYGTTSIGGASGGGTVFQLSTGIDPFVEIQPTAGQVGSPVTIVGENLTGSISVTFNGTAAQFTVISRAKIMTAVPIGATTGYVGVTTPRGRLESNRPFVVRP